MARKRKRFNRGRWTLQRERCRLETHAPPDPTPEKMSISEFIPGIMKKLGLEQEQWTTLLDREWVSLVGETVAAHTRPGRYSNRQLTVFVDSATWLNELKRYNQAEMLKNLQTRFGADKIRRLSLAPDPDPQ